MKLKHEIEKIEDGKVYIPFEKGFRQKIFATNFATLLGENQYNSKGYGVLKTFSMLEKEYFDPFYTLRGAIAEYFLYLHMTSLYEHMGLKDFVWKFSEEQYDDFKDNKFYGGKVDMELIKEPLHIIHECKAKDIDKYDNYKEDIAEVRQGELYCLLKNTNKLVMGYVFPNEKVIKAINKWLENKLNNVNDFLVRKFITENKITIDDFKFIIKNKTVDLNDIKQKANQAYVNVQTCFKQGYIPTDWFNAKDVNELGLLPF